MNILASVTPPAREPISQLQSGAPSLEKSYRGWLAGTTAVPDFAVAWRERGGLAIRTRGHHPLPCFDRNRPSAAQVREFVELTARPADFYSIGLFLYGIGLFFFTQAEGENSLAL
jgi:hypothetical protein